MTHTGFYSNERTFWHCTGVQALFLPLGEWVQPPTGSYGADTPDSKRRLVNLANASGLMRKLAVRDAAPATVEDMLRIHPKTYIDAFKAASDAEGGDLGMIAPFSKGGFEIAGISAGLAIQAVNDVIAGEIDNGYALCRPAGHHCLCDMSMGFCLLANIPIAIEAARARHGLDRVAVVDWDVHHGNGTQSIYYDSSDVLTISVHQDRCFPPGYSGTDDRGEGRGLGFNVNIPLPAGSGHRTYLEAFEKIVLPALYAYKPDLIVVASGLDANAVDPLARMLLHSETYRALTDLMVKAAADLCAGRLAVVHEGGYAEAYVPFCGHAILEALSGERTAVADPELEFFELQQPGDRIQAFHSELIAEMAAALSIG
ncbi:MAG TPA: class II histone deacetylase [Sphingomonadaceae bacterium]|nr:class II histone deacetylase [Sphingomonadaceae bacterium]